MPRLRQTLIRYAAALGWVVLSAGVAELLFRLTASTRLSMVFLAGVLLTAFLHGSGPAYFAAGLAFFAYNFYLVEPRFSVSIEAEDVLNLVVFLGVAMLTGNLTGRVRDQAARAEARARTTDTLFRATREFSALSDETAIRQRLAHHLASASDGAAFVREGESLMVDPVILTPPGEVLSAAAAAELEAGDAGRSAIAGSWTLRPLRIGGLALGVAAWREDSVRPLGEEDRRLLEILADAGATALDRARLAAAKTEAETRARTEDLRNALLSSISHDLRTPLAAILASATSLQQFGESFDAATRQDLAATIQEEAERMEAFVGNLLNMTRLEAGAVVIHKVAFSVAEVVSRTVQRQNRGGGRIVLAGSLTGLPEGIGDAALFEQAFANVLENGLRHTPDGAPLSVAGRSEGDRILVEVIDDGPGVAPEALPRIFEKFYRAPAAVQRAGTGLGLSIARGVLEAMDGGIEARNRSDGHTGLHVTITLAAA